MTIEERFDALLTRLEQHLDAADKRETELKAGLRLELNQIHERIGHVLATVQNVADNTSAILAEQNRLREGVTDQIQLEVQKQLDAHLPFTMRAAANGTLER